MRIHNKRASFDYDLHEHYEAGINLLGAEVKAVREGRVDLTGSHVRIIGSEAYLVGASIFPYEYARPEQYDERRTRKLLLHRSQILMFRHKMSGANLTIVPISLYTTGSLIKLEIALGKGKKEYQKKESKKQKDLKRELERQDL
ncbi:MAG TPA: SsrA-binding protein SmpB [Patescibacteria group bacterium]|nr:SsrA-binding protein SmpB [Patescibacteria group bacterium]